jgi:hypothetical protein
MLVFPAFWAFLILISKSMYIFLPAGFFYSRYLAFGRHFPEAYPAQAEIAHIAAFPPAAEAPKDDSGAVFRFLFSSRDDGFFCHMPIMYEFSSP